ncbi:hypothetical protein [Priestia megaterium]|uniref:hypothetical protein n=1 Tax=Priestia megaterium TaxID=1404 RepID=UPI001AE03AEC|nr:hypothetical protein [Priestia megaterium]
MLAQVNFFAGSDYMYYGADMYQGYSYYWWDSYPYRTVGSVQSSNPSTPPGYNRIDHKVYDSEIPEFRRRSCVKEIESSCWRCHDRRLWAGGPIVTTCGFEKCKKPFNTFCIDVRSSRLEAAVAIFIPQDIQRLIDQSIQRCNDSANVQSDNILKLEIKKLIAEQNLSESSMKKALEKSSEVWLNTFSNCVTSDPQLRQQIISSVRIVPWYSMRPIENWKQVF